MAEGLLAARVWSQGMWWPSDGPLHQAILAGPSRDLEGRVVLWPP